jgi:ArsR family transcriptional regulator
MPGSNSDRARKMKVLADDTRLAIVRERMHGPKRVNETNERVKIEQSLLSHHLRVLREARIVTSSREGSL